MPLVRHLLLLWLAVWCAACAGHDRSRAAGEERRQAASARAGAPVESAADLARREALARAATIRRDRYGVPHILAESEAAAAFAHGYVTAEDHLETLARLFLRARGELASVFGEAFAQQDLRTRALGIFDVASERMRELPPFMQGILDGYADGYNAFLARHPERAPAWARPITGVDVLAHARAVLLGDFALNLGAWAPGARPAGASNMWAIGRGLSRSGRGMLLANPHVRWDGSTLFHEVHLTVTGVINVSGATFIGVPVVTIGFNDSLGWSHTVNQVDSDDVYELTLDPTGTQYAYDGGWRPLASRTIAFDVRTANGVVTRAETVHASHHGPVNIRGGRAYALRSANLSSVGFLMQWNAMGKARTLAEFTDAVRMQQLPMFNIAYADRLGNIWYVFNGRIPRRPAGYDWAGVVPGGTSRTEWTGIRPFGELPQLLNPKSGYVQNANDAPWYTNLRQRIEPARFRDYIAGGGLGWRSQLGLRILSGERALTLERLMRHKFNAEAPFARRILDELLPLVDARRDPAWREAARVLRAWDGQADAGSRGAVLYAAWWDLYVAAAGGRPFRVPWSAADAIGTPRGLADRSAALAAFARAVERVRRQHGALDVAWGDVHRLRRGTVDLPLGGLPDGLQNIHYGVAADGRFVAEAGDSYVLAVEFSAGLPRAWSILAHSQSSNPASPHYSDQSVLYANERYKPAWFAEADIEANLSRRYQPGQ